MISKCCCPKRTLNRREGKELSTSSGDCKLTVAIAGTRVGWCCHIRSISACGNDACSHFGALSALNKLA